MAIARPGTGQRPGSSPPRAGGWLTLREIFGDQALALLVDISRSSLRRYAAKERPTPPEVADRLRWLATVVAELRGSYNDLGIRRWFARPRVQLDGKNPREVLGQNWHSSSPGARRVRNLARDLLAGGAT